MRLKEDGRMETLIKRFWNDLECSDNEDNGGDGDDDDAIEEVCLLSKPNEMYNWILHY